MQSVGGSINNVWPNTLRSVIPEQCTYTFKFYISLGLVYQNLSWIHVVRWKLKWQNYQFSKLQIFPKFYICIDENNKWRKADNMSDWSIFQHIHLITHFFIVLTNTCINIHYQRTNQMIFNLKLVITLTQCNRCLVLYLVDLPPSTKRIS